MTLSELKQKESKSTVTDEKLIAKAVTEFVNLPLEKLYNSSIISAKPGKYCEKGEKMVYGCLRMIRNNLAIEFDENETAYDLVKRFADYRSKCDPHTEEKRFYGDYCGALTPLSLLYKGFADNPNEQRREEGK